MENSVFRASSNCSLSPKKGVIQLDFLVVTDSKLKIMMSKADMQQYGIDGADIDYDDPKIRRSFWRILDVAKTNAGFDVAGDKVLIQFYPSKDGCEIFVTKLGVIPQGAERAISKSGKVAMLSCRRAVYKFTSLDDMLGAVKIIESEGCEKRPQAFMDDNLCYYIIADERRASSDSIGDLSPLTEFGREIPPNISAYISEHATELDFEVLKKL